MNLPIAKVLFRLSVWLAAEIFLNFLGLDNLADYSEFIFERNVVCIVQLDIPALRPLS